MLPQQHAAELCMAVIKRVSFAPQGMRTAFMAVCCHFEAGVDMRMISMIICITSLQSLRSLQASPIRSPVRSFACLISSRRSGCYGEIM